MQTKSDAEIHRAVLEALRSSSGVHETDVGVEVDRGVVTLSGTVDCFAKRLAAREAAHRVPGVLDVADDVVVSPQDDPQVNDTALARVVRNALERARVPHEQIQSTVSNGWVLLEGAVEFGHQRTDAEAAIQDVEGVAGVTNKLVVLPPSAEVLAVRDAIEEALERRADRAVDRLSIVVDHGTATLAGMVRSAMEKRAVLGAARSARGIRAVRDELRVERRA